MRGKHREHKYGIHTNEIHESYLNHRKHPPPPFAVREPYVGYQVHERIRMSIPDPKT